MNALFKIVFYFDKNTATVSGPDGWLAAQVSTSCRRKYSQEAGCCQGNVVLSCDGCWELQVSDYGAVLKGCPVSLCKSGTYPESPKGGAPGWVKGSFTEPVLNDGILGDADVTSQGLRCGSCRGKKCFWEWAVVDVSLICVWASACVPRVCQHTFFIQLCYEFQ